MEYELKEMRSQPAGLLSRCRSQTRLVMPHGGNKLTILGAFTEGEVVGTIMYTFLQERESLTYDRTLSQGVYIERLGVEKQYRRNGIGRSLVEACIRDARIQSKDNKRMYGDPLNHEASAFFEKCGVNLMHNTLEESNKEADKKAIEFLTEKIEEAEEGKLVTSKIVDSQENVVGEMPMHKSFLERMRNDFREEGLTELLNRNGYKLIYHDISDVDPDFFLTPGDLQDRIQYWEERIN